MILLEFLWQIVKKVSYHILRLVIWLITARDCRHCQYGRWNGHGKGWNTKNWTRCDIKKYSEKEKCMACPWRCNFKRSKGIWK